MKNKKIKIMAMILALILSYCAYDFDIENEAVLADIIIEEEFIENDIKNEHEFPKLDFSEGQTEEEYSEQIDILLEHIELGCCVPPEGSIDVEYLGPNSSDLNYVPTVNLSNRVPSNQDTENIPTVDTDDKIELDEEQKDNLDENEELFDDELNDEEFSQTDKDNTLNQGSSGGSSGAPETPETPEIEPETPEIEPETPETEPETPETPEIEPETPEVEPETPEIEPETPETPEVEPEEPETEPETPEEPEIDPNEIVVVDDSSVIVSIKDEYVVGEFLDSKFNELESIYLEKDQIHYVVINAYNTNDKDIIGFVASDDTFLPAIKLENTRTQTYYVKIDEYNMAQIEELSFKTAMLTSNYGVKIKYKTNLEVLKDTPIVENVSFSFDDITNTENIKFNVKDDDNAINGNITVQIFNENNNALFTQVVEKSANFDVNLELNQNYTLKVFVDFDRDSNQLNEITGQKNVYTNELVYTKTFKTEKLFIEYKDLIASTIYNTKTKESIAYIDSSEEFNTDEHIIVLEFRDMPSITTKISNMEFINGECYLTIDRPDLVTYKNGEYEYNYKVLYDSKNENGEQSYTTIKSLVDAINENPTGTFKLTSDLDASTYGSYISLIKTFGGTLDGNGFAIKNLTGALFETIENATIKNLIFENIQLDYEGYTNFGTLARIANTSTVQNVHITDGYIIGANTIGGLIGKGVSTMIEECSVNIDLYVSGSGANDRGVLGAGGIIAYGYGGYVENSYSTGSLTATATTYIGAGGISGRIEVGFENRNCYSSMTINNINNGFYVAGLNGTTYANGIVRNGIAFGEINGGDRTYKVCGYPNYTSYHYNTYQVEGTKGSESSYLSYATQEEIETKEFYTEKLTWSEDVWDFTEVPNGKYPTLKNSVLNFYEKEEEKQPQNKNVYIPNYIEMVEILEFDINNEIAYHNAYKLMPFYDTKAIVRLGNALSGTFKTKIIDTIHNLSEEKLYTGVSTDTYENVNGIYILYKDETHEILEVNEPVLDEKNGIVIYNIKDYNVIYSPDLYVTDSSNNIVKNLINEISNITYQDTEIPVGGEYLRQSKWTLILEPGGGFEYIQTDAFLIEEYYPEIQQRAEEFVYGIMNSANHKNIFVGADLEIAEFYKDTLEEDLPLSLFVRTYLDRWYGKEVGGLDLAELMFYHTNSFENTSTNATLIDAFRDFDDTNRVNLESQCTQLLFNSKLINVFNSANLVTFLEDNMRIYGGYENPNDWFSNNFNGILREISVDDNEEALYRGWDLLKNNAQMKDGQFLLPAFSYPNDDLYIVSYVGGLTIGSISSYSEYYDYNGTVERIDVFASYVKDYYNAVSRIVPDFYELIPSKRNVSWDCMADPDHGNGWADHRELESGAFRYFHAASNYGFSNTNSGVAYANGNIAWFLKAKILLNEYTYSIWAHENGHNQDGTIYLNGEGRKTGVNAEVLTYGLFQPSTTSNYYSINFGYRAGDYETAYVNRSGTRYESTDDFSEFNKRIAETINVLDILEMEVLMEQPVEIQQMYLSQWEHGDLDDQNMTNTLTDEELIAMNLTSYEAFINNRLVARNRASTSDNSPVYFDIGYFSIPYATPLETGNNYTVRRAQRRWMIEGMGYKGYFGLVEMLSAVSGKNNTYDLAMYTTGYQYETMEEYRLDTFNKLRERIDNEGLSIYSEEDIKQMMREAMELDAQTQSVTFMRNVRDKIYLQFKELTDEFREDIFGESKTNSIEISSAHELQLKISQNRSGNFILINDIDMSEIEPLSTNAYIITQFQGILDGNGFEIKNSEYPLFNSTYGATIKSVVFTNSNINAGSSVVPCGSIINSASYTIIEDVHIEKGYIQGENQVGGLIGTGVSVLMNTSSFTGTVEARGSFASGIMYLNTGGYIKNTYAGGNVSSQTRASSIMIDNRSDIQNCYSTMTITSGNASGIVSYNQNSYVLGFNNNAYFGNTTGHKIAEINLTTDDRTKNNYYATNTYGTETFVDGYTIPVDLETYQTLEFYIDILGFDEEIWDFDNFDKYPKFKSELDDNQEIAVDNSPKDIKSAEEFVKYIGENPFGNFNIMNDIDFEDVNCTSTSYISSFAGQINGNGFTIKNTKYPLFSSTIGAEIYDIAVSKPQISLQSTNNVGAIVNSATNTIIENVHIIDGEILGAKLVGGLIGYNIQGGSITKSSFTGNVTSNDIYAGGIAGAVYSSGIIENCYVSGNITGTNYVGGITGEVRGTIKNCYSTATVTGTDESGTLYIAGIVGRANSGIINLSGNLAIGHSNSYKFAQNFTTTASIIYNNFMVLESKGLTHSSVSTDVLQSISYSEIFNKEFFKDTLNWSEDVWDFNDIVQNKFPKLKTELDDLQQVSFDINENSAENIYSIYLDTEYIIKKDTFKIS